MEWKKVIEKQHKKEFQKKVIKEFQKKDQKKAIKIKLTQNLQKSEKFRTFARQNNRATKFETQ